MDQTQRRTSRRPSIQSRVVGIDLTASGNFKTLADYGLQPNSVLNLQAPEPPPIVVEKKPTPPPTPEVKVEPVVVEPPKEKKKKKRKKKKVEAKPDKNFDFLDSDDDDKPKKKERTRSNAPRMKMPTRVRKRGPVEGANAAEDNGPKHGPNWLSQYYILNEDLRRKYTRLFDDIKDEHGEIDELTMIDALKRVNNNLISDEEVEYVRRMMQAYSIAAVDPNDHESPKPDPSQGFYVGEELFCVMAALSERVVGLEGVVRKSINTMDFESFEKKLLRARDLYTLNQNAEGIMEKDELMIMLDAGRLNEFYKGLVVETLIDKDDLNPGVDFLDFVAYVPLFTDIHDDITYNPIAAESRPLRNLLKEESQTNKFVREKEEKEAHRVYMKEKAAERENEDDDATNAKTSTNDGDNKDKDEDTTPKKKVTIHIDP